MRHILILDYLHVYNDRRMMQQATALARLGYAVTVIGTVRNGQHAFHETREGVAFMLPPLVSTNQPLKIVTALWRWLRGDPRNVVELPTSGLLASTSLALFLYTLWAVRIGFKLPADLIHCHEHTPLLAAWILARLKRVPLVYDEHDNMEFLRIYGWKGRIAEQFERVMLRYVDAVTTIGERLAADMRKLNLRRVEVIGSWRRKQDFEVSAERLAQERLRLGLDRFQLTISFISTLHPIRDIAQLLAAVEQSPQVGLLIGGRGPLEKAVIEAAARSPNIMWLGWVEAEDIPVYTHLSDVVYNCVVPGPYDHYMMPNKLFDAIAAGKAIIVRRGIGEMGDTVEREGMGILLDEVTPETLLDAFRQLQEGDTLARLQARARAAQERYDWAVAEARLQTLFEDLIGKSK